MLYKVVTLTVGTEDQNDLAARTLSRHAKEGFMVEKVTLVALADGVVIAHYLLQRVPLAHLGRDENGMERIQLGDKLFNYEPCKQDLADDTIK